MVTLASGVFRTAHLPSLDNVPVFTADTKHLLRFAFDLPSSSSPRVDELGLLPFIQAKRTARLFLSFIYHNSCLYLPTVEAVVLYRSRVSLICKLYSFVLAFHLHLDILLLLNTCECIRLRSSLRPIISKGSILTTYNIFWKALLLLAYLSSVIGRNNMIIS